MNEPYIDGELGAGLRQLEQIWRSLNVSISGFDDAHIQLHLATLTRDDLFQYVANLMTVQSFIEWSVGLVKAELETRPRGE